MCRRRVPSNKNGLGQLHGVLNAMALGLVEQPPDVE
jgi:hypothetical protein